MKVQLHRFLSTSCLTVVLFAAGTTHANPIDGVVAGGGATISEVGKKLEVLQTTDRVVIDWRSFSIAPGEQTQFTQPSNSSIALNRVNDVNPSVIAGKLSANGNIILVNPNGVFFSNTSVVDVNSIVATTASIDPSKFMQGSLAFDIPGDPNGYVINNGQITAKDAGLVGLVAPNVINNGIITAKLGRVHLASGDTMTVDLYGDGLLSVKASDAITSQLVQNTGSIHADGGTIALTAAAGRSMVNSVVKVSGELLAPTVGVHNGKIIIDAEGSNAVVGNIAANKGTKTGTSSVIISNATLDVSGHNSGEHGGSISITADLITLNQNTVLNADGVTGGGIIHIGGQYLGGGDTPAALITIVDQGVVITANAIEPPPTLESIVDASLSAASLISNGTSANGGEVIVYADEHTEFNGHIEANGLGKQGDGGFIETSGRVALLINTGNVSASGRRRNGTWLLDPADITITAATNTNITGATPYTPTNTGSQVSAATIKGVLDGGTNVTVQTSNDGFAGNGDITVSSAITTVGSGSLTLSAYRNIIVSSAITLQGGNLTLRADNASNNSGYIQVNAAISTNGGNITMGGGNGVISAGSGFAKGNAGVAQGIVINNVAVNAGGGNIIMNGTGGANAGNSNYGIWVSGATAVVSTTGSGTVTLTGTGAGITNSGSDDGVYINAGGIVSTVDGALSVTGTAGGAGTGTSNRGVEITGANSTIKTTGLGNLSITGTGGNNAGTGAGSDGIRVNTANGIQTTGSGTMTLNGTNSNSSGGQSAGVMVINGSIIGGGGAINITAYGGTSSGTNNNGVQVYNVGDSITNIGNGAITMNITAGGSANSAINGLFVAGTISTVNGNLSITATGGGAGSGGGYGILDTGTIRTTGAGNISLNGTGGNSTSTGSNIFGVYISSGTVTTSSTGNISVTGLGGGGSGTGSGQVGVRIDAVNGIRATGSGSITVNATGADGSLGSNGLYISGGSIVGNGGAMNITALSSNVAGSNAFGIYLNGATAAISNAGTGTLTISSTSRGTGNSSADYGMFVGAGAIVSTVDGNLSITGQGGGAGTGVNNFGLYITGANSTVKTTGLGNISITGTGGNAAGSGGSNYGIYSNIANGIQTTGSGSITLRGIKGGQASSFGVLTNVANGVTTTGTGNITVYTDTISLNLANNINTAGVLTLAPYTNSSMGVGTAAGGTLNLTDTSLGYITGGSYIFGALIAGDGTTSTSNVTVNTGANFANKNLSFISGNDISLAGTLAKTSGVGTATYLFQAKNTISASAGVNATSGNINLTMTSDSDVSGAGNISLTNAALSVNGGTITLNSNGQSVSQSGSIGGNETINSSNGGVSIGTLNGDTAGTRSLTINAGSGMANFASNVGATTTLSSLVVNGAATLNGNITTSGAITFINPVTLGANSGTNSGSGTTTFGGTVNGGFNYTGLAGAFSFASNWGNTTPLNVVSLTSTNALTLPSISAASIFARTTGATSDLTIDVGKTLTASGAGNAITLASGRNFINGSGSATPLSTPAGRWLIYSTNPASDTLGGITSTFRRFSCTYGGSCPSIPGTGNGFLYNYTPTLTITPTAFGVSYGDASPSLVGYAYGASGYLGSDGAADILSGVLTGNSSYSPTSNVGTYNVNYSSGALVSAMGYGFTYANNANALIVGKKALTVTANSQTVSFGTVVPGSSITYTGFVNGENSSVIDTLATLNSAQAGIVNAGTYARNYTASGALDDNYSFTYVDGNLVVTPGPSASTLPLQVISSFNYIPNFTYTVTVNIPSTIAAQSGSETTSQHYEINTKNPTFAPPSSNLPNPLISIDPLLRLQLGNIAYM